jgi:hypothetical protein
MARLIRANSLTPNVANNDDFRILRYATGGYNGVIENYGNECSYTVIDNNFKINSGEIFYQGVDTEILTAGETITVDNISGTQYYVVYLEIDLSDSANQTAIIKSSYDVSDYPVISAGDDLTTVPSGVANFELYRFTASSGVVSNVVAQFNIVEVGNVLHAKNADLSTNATNATNVENAINENGGTYGKLYTDENGILRYGDIIIPQAKVIWEGSSSSVNLSGLGVVAGNYLEIETDFETSEVVTVYPTNTEKTSWLSWVNNWTNYGVSLISEATLKYSLSSVFFDNNNSVTNGIKTDNIDPNGYVMKNYTSTLNTYNIKKITRIIR